MAYRMYVGNKEIKDLYVGGKQISRVYGGNTLLWERLEYPYAYLSLMIEQVRPDGYNYIIDEYGLGLEFDKNCKVEKVGVNLETDKEVPRVMFAFKMNENCCVKWSSFQARNGIVRNKFVNNVDISGNEYVYLSYDNVDVNGKHLADYLKSYSSKNVKIFINDFSGMYLWVKE